MHVCFNGACLREADLRVLTVEYSEFEGTAVTGADLTDAILSSVNRHGCHPRPEEWRGPARLVRSQDYGEVPGDDDAPRLLVQSDVGLRPSRQADRQRPD